jgi:hypothetical protein
LQKWWLWNPGLCWGGPVLWLLLLWEVVFCRRRVWGPWHLCGIFLLLLLNSF